MAPGRRRGGPVGSVAIFAAAAAATVTAALLFAAMHFAAVGDAAAFRDRMYRQSEDVFRAAVDPRFQSKADEVNRVLDRLVVIDAIKGGALFDESGHLQKTFGEVPDTSFESIRHARAMSFTTRDARRVEFYFPPEVTGTPYHILARVDTGSATALEVAGAGRRTVFALVGGAAAGSAAFFFVVVSVSMPVRRLVSALEAIVANPAGADQVARLKGGIGEVGALAAGLDGFRSTLAEVWRTKVAVADAILESSPFGVVQLASDGSPTFANPAAVDLFEREVTRGQDAEPLAVRDVATGTRSALRDHVARHRTAPRLVEIAAPGGVRFAVAGSLTVGTDTRAPTTIVMFSDVTDVHAARLDAESRFASGARQLRTAHRRELELKLTLESCIMLMSGPDRGEEEHLDAVPFAVEWLAAARETGMAGQTHLAAAEGPMVAGASDDLRALVRLGLLVCYARCGAAPADIVVDAKGIDFETAGFTIRAQQSATGGEGAEPVVADWQLAFAALRTAVRRVGGQLAEFSATENGVVLKLVLRGAAERMATVKAR